jgi:uncharacterized repeat protein (TIGR01451 family)
MLVTVVATALATAGTAAAALVAPVQVAGNPACSGQTKIEPVRSGTFGASFGGAAGSITVTVRNTSSGQVFDFATDSASHLVTLVTVKGGSNANIYNYGVPGVASDTDLHAPDNGGKWYGLSHLCFGTALAPPPTDVCPNIPGNQATIPPGMIKDASGNCVTPPTDVCPNIAGVQTSVPPGMVKDAAGNCVTPPPPPTDECPNIAGVQTSVPSGMVKDASGNCVTPPTDVCPNIAGVQETVPPGMVKDASGNCVTPPGPPAPLVDLAVTKLDTPDPVSVGNLLHYTIRATNRGPGQATGVTVTDVLPSSLKLVSTKASQGSCSAAGARITCRLGTLAVGDSATVTVMVRPGRPGLVVNAARVVGNEGDPNPRNNTSSVTTRVVAPFQPPAAPRCDSVTVGTRTITVGVRTTLRVVVKARGRALARVRVRVSGAGIDLRALTNRRGVALVSVRARRSGIVTITVANESCQRRIGAITGGQPELTG